nr:sigma-70 family RNA polymerase sigma factor [Vibrio splendidus]MCC4880421.1 sigma-70 family RNA polymerase sigma factor [Vibrio splendidus]
MFESANKFKKYALAQAVVTENEEQELARKIQESKCKDSLDKLFLSHLKLVIGIASRYTAAHSEKIDLYQEGCIGLMKAAQRYMPGVGVRFSTFASFHVKSEMREFAICNFSLVKVATSKKQRKVFFNSSKLLNTSKDKLGLEEKTRLAETYKIEVSDIDEMEIRMKGYGLVTTTTDQNDNVVDYDFPVYVDMTDSIQDHRDMEDLNVVLSSLNPREQDVIKSRWLTDNKVGLLELGIKHGISAERVRQVESNAIKKMQTMAMAMAA